MAISVKSWTTFVSRDCQLVVGKKIFSSAFLSCLIPQNQKCQHNGKILWKDFSGAFPSQEFENCRFSSYLFYTDQVYWSHINVFWCLADCKAKNDHSAAFGKLLESSFFMLHSLDMQTLLRVRMLYIAKLTGILNTFELEHQWPVSTGV